MSTCDTCRAPGSCCTSIPILKQFGSLTDAEWFMRSGGYEYLIPIRPNLNSGAEGMFLFKCERLGEDGRCTDYENRPSMCSNYQPKECALCAEWEPTFKGIPIRRAPATQSV